MHVVYGINEKAFKLLTIHISVTFDQTLLKLCASVSLTVTFICAKFQIKIQGYDIMEKLSHTRRIH
jgi:hypothetical protein